MKICVIHDLIDSSSRPEVFNCRPQACNFIEKETLAQVFSCEICEIFKNTFFYKTPLVAAFELSYDLYDLMICAIL